MVDISASRARDRKTLPHFLSSPITWLWLTVAAVLALLTLPLAVPIGPMYWDTYIYLDAAQRIRMGQIPSLDFSTPVGALGYYLFAWGLDLLPRAQPLLLVQWSQLAVTAPLMTLVLIDAEKKSRAVAFLLLIPFLVFAAFPANAQFFHSYPGLDGFGIYNRQTSLLLYVLTSGLVFMRGGPRFALFCALAMLALFLTKITGFLVGGLIGLGAVLAGRISLANLALAAIAFLLPLAVIELGTGMISAYIRDILDLIAMNQDALLPRFLTVASGKLDVLMPAGLLLLVMIWADLNYASEPRRFFDRSFWWFGISLLGGTILETQNTGSQEFIFIWPVLLMAYDRLPQVVDRTKIAFLVLAAFCTVPTLSKVAHKTLRSVAVAPTYVTPDVPLLRNMQQVSTRKDVMERAVLLENHYATQGAAYIDLANQGQLPSWQLYSELDYQTYWIISADILVKALLQFETDNQIRLQSLMTLDFVNPFPWILDRDATRKIQIGADPFRTVRQVSSEALKAVQATDGVLRPKCPVTTGRRMLEERYAQALAGRQVVALDPCWDLLLRPGILKAQ
ncbi:MAG: hypothetical protein ACK4P4_11410 [Allorhizobium sp.]|uniref:Glycosyltransferase RgtA/B/C/D-like domain-containing protein n=1 Tax=Rhizobium rosettiformans TaxID=1368430 RepID=A0ABX7ERL3_9HYPH|nr:hypothetical protein D4A92_03425 [Rhizobium rosettiformans]